MWADHALELADEPDRVQGRPRPGYRVHRGAEALGDRTVLGVPVRRDHRCRRVPPGVFNLVNGDGPTAGHSLAAHPEVDMMSFTGSTRAGVEVAKAAAPGVKRVAQELGGKSPNIILEDADLREGGHLQRQERDGQLRPVLQRGHPDAGAPTGDGAGDRNRPSGRRVNPRRRSGGQEVDMGPVVSMTQWKKVQGLIAAGHRRGRHAGHRRRGRPAGLERGYYVKPTVFANVKNAMRIAQEEIFGPVLTILGIRHRG